MHFQFPLARKRPSETTCVSFHATFFLVANFVTRSSRFLPLKQCRCCSCHEESDTWIYSMKRKRTIERLCSLHRSTALRVISYSDGTASFALEVSAVTFICPEERTGRFPSGTIQHCDVLPTCPEPQFSIPFARKADKSLLNEVYLPIDGPSIRRFFLPFSPSMFEIDSRQMSPVDMRRLRSDDLSSVD